MAVNSEVIGVEGLRVRIYQRVPGGPFQREVKLRLQDGSWKTDRESLGHRDQGKARGQARLLLAALLKKQPHDTLPNTQAGLRLGGLISLYTRSEEWQTIEPKTRRDRAKSFAILAAYFGTDFDLKLFNNSHALRYTKDRLAGTFAHPQIRVRKGSRACQPQTVKNDLAALRTAALWAYGQKDREGNRLLAERIFDGVTLPEEKNPRQPLISDSLFDQLLAVADTTRHPMFRVALILAEAFGNRISSIRHLAWADIRWADREVWWNPIYDKMEYERTSHIPDDVLAALAAWRDDPSRLPSPWILYAPADPTRPVSENRVQLWMTRAFTKLGTPRPKGFGWHALRRKWNTDRKDLPMKDVMAAGGWKSLAAFLRYQQPDKATMRAVMTHRRRARGDTVGDSTTGGDS